MKLRKSILAMLLCSGLVIALGLTACGSNGDDEVDCAKALAEIIQDPDCVPDVTDGIVDYRECLETCAGDQACEEAECEPILSNAAKSCEPAASILDEDCGCQVCGNNFDSCVRDATTPAADCVSGEGDVIGIIPCLTDCVPL